MQPFARVLFLLSMASLAIADEVELTTGELITDCKITDLGDSYKVVKGPVSRIILKTDVRRVEFKETREETYAKRAATLKPDDLDGHLSLARWCQTNNLSACAAKEYSHILSLTPDHEEARLALGFQRYEGTWLTEEEVNQAKGLVKHKGRWMTPAERDLDVALEEQRDLDRKLTLEVRRLLDRLTSSDEKKRQAAMEALSQIDDTIKVKPLLTAITLSSKSLRLFATAELGRIRSVLGDQAWTATKALARRAIWDEVEQIRAEAVKSLVEINHPDAALSLTPYLEEESTVIRIRVEEALGQFKDLRALPPLFQLLEQTIATLQFIEQYEKDWAKVLRDAIITRDGRRIAIPARLRVSPELFDRESKRRLSNERDAVLAALVAITGENFGEEVATWRAWVDKKKAEPKK